MFFLCGFVARYEGTLTIRMLRHNPVSLDAFQKKIQIMNEAQDETQESKVDPRIEASKF